VAHAFKQAAINGFTPGKLEDGVSELNLSTFARILPLENRKYIRREYVAADDGHIGWSLFGFRLFHQIGHFDDSIEYLCLPNTTVRGDVLHGTRSSANTVPRYFR
jgi:hypothetical protein